MAVIAVTGWEKEGAAWLAAAMAGMSALAVRKRTLMIQLTNPGKLELSGILAGKQLRAQQIDALAMEFKDEGIDSLLRIGQMTKLTADAILECVTPLLNRERLLDYAQITNKMDFLAELADRRQEIKQLLQAAGEIYENIFCLLPENPEISEALKDCFDCMVVLVRQQPIASEEKEKNAVYAVMDFDADSMYSLFYMKKAMKVGALLALYRDITFRDACMEGNLLLYLQKNLVRDKENRFQEGLRQLLFLCKAGGEVGNCKSRDFPIWEKISPYDEICEVIYPCVPAKAVKITVQKKLFSTKERVVVDGSFREEKTPVKRKTPVKKKETDTVTETVPKTSRETVVPEKKTERETEKKITKRAPVRKKKEEVETVITENTAKEADKKKTPVRRTAKTAVKQASAGKEE